MGGHFIYNNTVFNSFEQGKNDIMALNTQGKDSNGDPIDINFGTIVMNNLAERIYGHRNSTTVISNNMYTANNYSPSNVEDVISSFSSRDFRPINDNNIINKADTSNTTANNYVSNLDSYNNDPSLSFSPGTAADKLTKDIGAMNINDSIWRAGITWNINLLEGKLLDDYVFNTRLDFYEKSKNINTIKTIKNPFFSKQRSNSVLNIFHKRISNNKKIISSLNNNYIKKTSSTNHNGSLDRILEVSDIFK